MYLCSHLQSKSMIFSSQQFIKTLSHFSISLADITPSKSKIVCMDFTFNRKNILMRLTIKIGR